MKGGGKPLRVYISGAGVRIFPNNLPVRASSFVFIISKIGIAAAWGRGNFWPELSIDPGLDLKSSLTPAAAIVSSANLIGKISEFPWTIAGRLPH